MKFSKRIIIPAILAFIVCLVATMLRPTERVDRVWSDVMLTSQKVEVPDDYLIVEVTADDLREFGAPFIQRETLAELLQHLDKAGANRILLDIILNGNLSSERDAPLVAAMSQIGSDRLAIARGSILPDPQFQAHAAVVDMRFVADKDGWTRQIGRAGAGSGYNPVFWLSGKGEYIGRVDIDLRYDTASIRRMSVNDILTAPSLDLSGLNIVVAHSSALAPSRTHLPLSENSDRATATVLGAVSMAADYPAKTRRAKRTGTGLALICLIIGLMLAVRTHALRHIVLAGLLMGCMLVWINIGLMRSLGGQSHPTMQFLCYLIGVFIMLGHRLKILQMLNGFLKGDLSPEEAWAWRSFEDSRHPVVLLNGMGGIRRTNAAAAKVNSLIGPKFGQFCQTAFNESSDDVLVTEPGENGRTFMLDWPNRAVPIIVLKDVTETAQQVDELRRKVVTDPLTGLLNRAGFDKALTQVGPDTNVTDYALLFMDMNGFKAVNDTYGHDAGDELLRIVSKRLAGRLGNDANLTRLGGDEFAAILKGEFSDEDIIGLIGDIETIVTHPIKLENCTVKVGLAVGYAQPCQSQESVEDVLHRADQAMYRRKTAQKQKAA